MTDVTDPLTGLVVVRGGGAALLWRRLPRRSTVSMGGAERHGLALPDVWVPRDLVTLTPVPAGWWATNGRRAVLQVESDRLVGGRSSHLPGGVVALPEGEARLTWPGLDGPVSLSVTVRTRRLEDQRVPYAVDARLPRAIEPGGRPEPGRAGYRMLGEAPMSLALRYRLAVLFRHLLDGDEEPVDLVSKRAAYLGIAAGELEEAAHRHRRRINAERGLRLGDLYELGMYLVRESGELTAADLDP